MSQTTHIDLKQRLYAVAVEIPIRHKGRIVSWVPEITHVHAEDSNHAKLIYLQDSHHQHHRIVAVGPVVGFHVEDEHGEHLRA